MYKRKKMKTLTIIIPLLASAATSLSLAQVGIGTTSPKAGLHVADSSVVFSAVDGIPAVIRNPPISGGGRRMMWYADKGAFRAGFAFSNEWDKSNIGDYSMALGFGATASGLLSVAMGTGAKAIGPMSVALGSGITASGNTSTALGSSTVASGSSSTAFGVQTTASGNTSTAMGSGTVASGDYSTAIGRNSKASGTSAFAAGESSKATGYRSIALGYVAAAENVLSTAIGYNTRTANDFSTSIGTNTIARGHSSLAIGNSVISVALAETAMGTFNTTYKTSDNSATERLFVIGNGYSEATRRDAFTVLNNGNIGIGFGVGNFHINAYKLSVNGSAAKVGEGSWSSTSDSRAKKNIEKYSAGLNQVLAIEPVSFQYNQLSGYADTIKTYVGVIAQEIEKVLPSTVSILSGDPLISNKRVFDNSELIYTLINAVKELHGQNQQLKQRLLETDSQVRMLGEEVRDLKERKETADAGNFADFHRINGPVNVKR
jgi:hypothetical protein